jgi:hypothetical protein
MGLNKGMAMTDFKHVEEQIANLKERGARERLLSVLDAADTMQALLDVAKIGDRIDKEAEPNHPWEAIELLRDALAKLQEQKQTLQECLQEELDELRAEQTKLREQNDE